ncbi:hypothetical protein HMPREF1557_00463 [Streptococcus sobrinus W1703]|uniref:Uncharacterized protein n=1 Tax=Streptococcus sobrinus W1703 TaxID=1227275 RepID=U2KLA2_9STRE|nr:hypothetical protein HMPREF1557_00463 [Streptococcus sobrinus W1703]
MASGQLTNIRRCPSDTETTKDTHLSQLLDKILSRDNMLEAYTQVKSNKGSVGVSLDEIEVYLRQH